MMIDVIQILFLFSVILELIYLVLFILTKKLPGFRFWPPPKPQSWQFFVSWLIAGLVAVNFLVLGLLDFDSFILPNLKQRLPFAISLFLIGSLLGSWAFGTFGLKNIIGVDNKLITGGPYKYSRNPQYIGDSLNIVGYMALTNSSMIWIIGLLGVLLSLLAPSIEEPWLEERYGERYLEYKCRVPRFFGKVGTG